LGGGGLFAVTVTKSVRRIEAEILIGREND